MPGTPRELHDRVAGALRTPPLGDWDTWLLHWWFVARPEGFGQLRSSFAEIWDAVFPPMPRDVWDANIARVVAHLEAA